MIDPIFNEYNLNISNNWRYTRKQYKRMSRETYQAASMCVHEKNFSLSLPWPSSRERKPGSQLLMACTWRGRTADVREKKPHNPRRLALST